MDCNSLCRYNFLLRPIFRIININLDIRGIQQSMHRVILPLVSESCAIRVHQQWDRALENMGG